MLEGGLEAGHRAVCITATIAKSPIVASQGEPESSPPAVRYDRRIVESLHASGAVGTCAPEVRLGLIDCGATLMRQREKNLFSI